jgi:hypothetical protein
MKENDYNKKRWISIRKDFAFIGGWHSSQYYPYSTFRNAIESGKRLPDNLMCIAKMNSFDQIIQIISLKEAKRILKLNQL